jgi:hypothetical protein
MRRLSAIPVQYVAALLLAAVIGGGIYALRSSSAPTNTPSPAGPSARQSPTIVHRPASVNAIAVARPDGEASKSPKQILADAASALRAATGFELHGVMSQGGQTMRIRLVESPPQSLDMAAATGAAAYEVLRVPTGFYVRGNASFWRQHLGARGALLADRWIHGYNSALASAFAHFAPARMARCLTEDHGTLSIGGTTNINGQPAIVIRDAGNLPGTQAGTLAVATTGPPYPLRTTGRGPQHPGGRIDVCNDGHASGSQDGSLTFSQFNRVGPLQAPTNAIETASPSPVS